MSLDTLLPLPDAPVTRVATPPRARGAVDLCVAERAGGTHIARLRQEGCLKCVLPTVFRNDAEAVLVNTSGGVTGGDKIDVRATLEDCTHLSITTQAAERIYRTLDGSTGEVRNHVTVGDQAQLAWLPQETILFDRARLKRNLTIDLAETSRLLLCETLVFGRAAMGEQVHELHLEDRICVTRNGAPLYRDGIRLNGDAAAQLARPAVGAGAGAVATVVCVSPDAQAVLGAVRDLLPPTAGASLLHEDVLVLRALAADSLALRRFMIPVLELLSGQSLPGVWRL